MQEKVIITVNDKQVTIGTVDHQHKWFRKDVQGSKHLFKSIGAAGSWGMDEAYFNEVLLPGNYQIGVRDSETMMGYLVSAEKFKEGAQYRTLGHSKQVFLPLELWESKKL